MGWRDGCSYHDTRGVGALETAIDSGRVPESVLGRETVNPLFADGHLHTSKDGAILNAQCVVEGLELLGDKDPLADYLLNEPAAPSTPAPSTQ